MLPSEHHNTLLLLRQGGLLTGTEEQAVHAWYDAVMDRTRRPGKDSELVQWFTAEEAVTLAHALALIGNPVLADTVVGVMRFREYKTARAVLQAAAITVMEQGLTYLETDDE